MDCPPLVEEALRAVDAAGDPLEAAVASRAARAALEAWERALVADACAGGRSWEAVGRAFGLSRQAAWERYRGDAPRRVPRLDAARARQRGQLAEARRLRAAARSAAGADRAALLRRADEVRATALAALEETRRETS